MVLSQVHGLDAETWKKVDVVYIDIADRTQVDTKVKSLRSILRLLLYCYRYLMSCVTSSIVVQFCFIFLVSLQDYKPEEDPCRYKSVKTGRGPLGPDWRVQCHHA